MILNQTALGTSAGNPAESRVEILHWLNSHLQLSLKRVEECGTGAVYCQIIDSIYQDVPMNKVKFGANQEWEYVYNYKILQEAFTKHSIDKPIPIQKLTKLKFQDNFDFVVWIKRWWESQGGSRRTYDPVGRRSGNVSQQPAQITTNVIKKKPQTVASQASVASTSMASSISTQTTNFKAPLPIRKTLSSCSSGESVIINKAHISKLPPITKPILNLSNNVKTELDTLRQSVTELQQERDFYFGKLREIELLLQESGVNSYNNDSALQLIQSIEQVLYATSEGFETLLCDNDVAMVDEDREVMLNLRK